MIDKLHTIITRYDELADLMSQPGAMQDMKALKKYIYTYKQLQEDEEILNGDDPELKELVKDEIGPLKEDIAKQEEKLKVLLIPKDPNDNKNTILGRYLLEICTACTFAMLSGKTGNQRL